MIILFDYKCRRCNSFFTDESKPEMTADNISEVELIFEDSLRQNPTAKKRAAIRKTHDCLNTQPETFVAGTGDLIGYRIILEQQQPVTQEDAKVLNFKKAGE